MFLPWKIKKVFFFSFLSGCCFFWVVFLPVNDDGMGLVQVVAFFPLSFFFSFIKASRLMYRAVVKQHTTNVDLAFELSTSYLSNERKRKIKTTQILDFYSRYIHSIVIESSGHASSTAITIRIDDHDFHLFLSHTNTTNNDNSRASILRNALIDCRTNLNLTARTIDIRWIDWQLQNRRDNQTTIILTFKENKKSRNFQDWVQYKEPDGSLYWRQTKHWTV